MVLRLNEGSGVGESPGGDAGLNCVRYRYRLLPHAFAIPKRPKRDLAANSWVGEKVRSPREMDAALMESTSRPIS
jgi:hypothetical protein